VRHDLFAGSQELEPSVAVRVPLPGDGVAVGVARRLGGADGGEVDRAVVESAELGLHGADLGEELRVRRRRRAPGGWRCS
jgi:hypothetical protein